MDKYKHIAGLIKRVLISEISVQHALTQFPLDEENDINIKCAFDALMHYEADEDIRSKDNEYAQLQNEYLEFLADTLEKGDYVLCYQNKGYYQSL